MKNQVIYFGPPLNFNDPYDCDVGTEYGYPPSILTGVYFGPDMEYAATEIIALILAGQNEHVKLWKGSLSKESFSVEFQQITYTPYLEAKRKGMLKTEDE